MLASLTFKAVHTETPPTSLIFLFLTILPEFLGHLPPLTSYFRFSLFLCSCRNYLELPS